MRPRRGHDDMVEVELVEVGDLDPDPLGADLLPPGVAVPDDPRDDDAGTFGPSRRRTGRWLVAGAVTVALVVTGASVHEAFRDRSARGLAVTHAVVGPLPTPPTEAWRSPGPAWAVPAGGAILLVPLAFQDPTLTLVDPRTGATRWTYELGWGGPGARTETACGGYSWLDTGVREHDVDVVACRVHVQAPGTVGVDPATGEATRRGPEDSVRMIVLDTGTGELVREVMSHLLGFDQIGADVVLATGDPDGTVRVRREDARTGTERWEHSEPVVPEHGRLYAFYTTQGVGMLHRERSVVAIDLETGRAIRRWEPPDGRSEFSALPTGGLAAYDGSTATTTVTDRDGADLFSVVGRVVVPTTTDRSVPDILLFWDRHDGVLRGHDARTGAERWTWEPPTWLRVPTWPVQVDGTLVVMDSSGLAAIDVRNGHQRWALERPTDQIGPVLTTGTSILFTEGHTGLEDLVSIALSDGTVEWTGDLPESSGLLVGVGGVLVSVFGDDVIALR